MTYNCLVSFFGGGGGWLFLPFFLFLLAVAVAVFVFVGEYLGFAIRGKGCLGMSGRRKRLGWVGLGWVGLMESVWMMG